MTGMDGYEELLGRLAHLPGSAPAPGRRSTILERGRCTIVRRRRWRERRFVLQAVLVARVCEAPAALAIAVAFLLCIGAQLGAVLHITRPL